VIATILLVLAFVLLLLAAFNVSTARISLGWLGMAVWCLSILLGGLHLLR
jgi:hypothetical protein